MARPRKTTIDYFPHFIKDGRSLFILESRWGNDGYTFLWKLMEMLCQSGNMVLDTGNPVTMEFLAAKCRISTVSAAEMLEKLAIIGKIDAELYAATKQVWCQDLVDSVQEVFKKRESAMPKKPSLSTSSHNNKHSCEQVINSCDDDDKGAIDTEEFLTQKRVYSPETTVSAAETPVSGINNPQIKLNKIKLNNNKLLSSISDYDDLKKILRAGDLPIEHFQEFNLDQLAGILLNRFRDLYVKKHERTYITGTWDERILKNLIKVNGFDKIDHAIDSYYEITDHKHSIKMFDNHISDDFERLKYKKRGNVTDVAEIERMFE